jgi:hypothetical protein
MKARKIDRSPHEPARNVARAIGKTEAFEQSRKERKKVEMLFAHLKRILKLDKLRLRGWTGARDEFLLGRHGPEFAPTGKEADTECGDGGRLRSRAGQQPPQWQFRPRENSIRAGCPFVTQPCFSTWGNSGIVPRCCAENQLSKATRLA